MPHLGAGWRLEPVTGDGVAVSVTGSEERRQWCPHTAFQCEIRRRDQRGSIDCGGGGYRGVGAPVIAIERADHEADAVDQAISGHCESRKVTGGDVNRRCEIDLALVPDLLPGCTSHTDASNRLAVRVACGEQRGKWRPRGVAHAGPRRSDSRRGVVDRSRLVRLCLCDELVPRRGAGTELFPGQAGKGIRINERLEFVKRVGRGR